MEGGAGIPGGEPQATHRSHIDTCFLLPLLGGGTDPGLRASTRQWVDERPGAPLGVSLPALGEAHLDLTCRPEVRPPRRDPSPYDRWVELANGGRVEVCWVDHQRPPGTLLQLAERIRREMAGSDFGVTDSLILACAVLCRGCDRLHTTDREMHRVPRPFLRKASGRFLLLVDRLPE